MYRGEAQDGSLAEEMWDQAQDQSVNVAESWVDVF